MSREKSNSWSQFWGQRLRRRRFLGRAALSGAALASLPLVACRGAEEPQPAPTGAAHELGTPRRGGILRTFAANAPTSWDTYVAWSGQQAWYASFLYPKLTKFKDGPDVKVNEYVVTLDLADRLEQPDDTTYIFHLNEKAVWQDVPPVNGRALTAQDVVSNMELFRAQHTNRALVAPYLDTVEAIDQSTVRFRLKSPLAPFPMYIGHAGGPFIYPPELREGDAVREKTCAAGPFLLDRHDVGTFVGYVRNPKYYKAPFPYVDGVNVSIIRDDSTVVANFRTGALDYTSWTAVPPADVPSLKQALRGATWISAVSPSTNQLTVDIGDSKFRDERVRQAISLTIDREGLLALTGGGYAYHTPLPPIEPWWIDPKKDAELSRYYVRDVRRAKELLAAAGFRDGLSGVTYNFLATSQTQREQAQLIAANLREAGIEVRLNPQEQAEYFSTTNVGKHFGQIGGGAGTFTTDPDEGFTLVYTPDSARSPIPNKQLLGDDKRLQDLILAQRRELDTARRKTIVDELQRYFPTKMYAIPFVVSPSEHVIQARVKNMYHRVMNYAFGGNMLDEVWVEG